jgi:hypothetical protein
LSVKVKNEDKNDSLDIISNNTSPSYLNFVNAIRSPATKEGYLNSLKRYMNHIKITPQTDDLLTNQSNPKLIESQIIGYIMSLRNDGISYSTIKYSHSIN